MGLLTERKKLFDRAEHMGDEIALKLRKSLPPALKIWWNEGGSLLVANLLEFGFSQRDYKISSLKLYGFSSLQDVVEKMRLLGEAWGDEVKIKTKIWTKDQEASVTFKVIE